MNRGYLALWRKIQDHPFYKERREFSKLEAWIDILMEVQHEVEPIDVTMGMSVIQCNYGESLKSIGTWARRWHWSESKVRRYFKLLKKLGQISTKSEGKTTRLTILNYKDYDPGATSKATNKWRANGEQSTTDKNVKNEKKYKRAISVLEFFAPVINGWDKSKVEKTIDGFISTRKTKQISSGVIQKEFKYWKQFPNGTINAALAAYVDGQHWKSGKSEKYLRGIIRGKDQAIQKESNQSLFQKAF
jgi:hypothetical protein